MSVNYIRHLQLFYELVKLDDRLHTSHISLYHALFQLWNLHRFQNPLPVSREGALKLCRIGSANTYTRCLKQLDEFGYLCYQPSAQKGTFSKVTILSLENDMLECGFFPPPGDPETPDTCRKIDTPPYLKTDTRNVKNDTRSCLKSDTRRVSKLRHFYKHINLKVNNEREAPAPIKKIKDQSGNAEQHENTPRGISIHPAKPSGSQGAF